MYHSDLASAMGKEWYLLVDLALHNLSQQKITFPAESVAVVSVNDNERSTYTPASEGNVPS
jgi:hypothetical protein